jgi:hypothetical protein
MNSLAPSSLDAQILQRVIAPNEPSLPPALAKAILRLSFNEEQQEEMQELLDRNNQGTITDLEQERLEAYVRVNNFLGLLWSKARITLARTSGKK